MNNSIINPWLIYAINMIDNISEILFNGMMLTIITLVVGIVLYLTWRIEEYSSHYKEDVKLDKKAILYLKRIGIALIIFILLNVLIPTKETMYTMVAMRYVTVENINGGIETVKAAVDYVFEKIEELDGAEGNNE